MQYHPALKRIWKKLGLSQNLLIFMFKNALAPTFGIWIIQSQSLNRNVDITGFLPAVISLIQPPSHPRVPYLRLFASTCLLTGLSLGVCLLAAWSSSQARIHTTPPGGDPTAYNSSQAAVSGVWLVFLVWVTQTWRTFMPSIGRGLIFSTMYCTIAIVYTSHMPTFDEQSQYCIQLFVMFFLGYAFSTAVSLVVFPQTARDVAITDVKEIFSLAQQVTSLQRPYGDIATFDAPISIDNITRTRIVKMTRKFAKFEIDLSEAKRDFGWTRMSTEDCKQLLHRFRFFLVPLRGFFAAEAIRATLNGAILSPTTGKALVHGFTMSTKGQLLWNKIFDQLQGPVEELGNITADAVDHCRMCLRVQGRKHNKFLTFVTWLCCGGRKKQRSSLNSDSESGSSMQPGGAEFIDSLAKRVHRAKEEMQMTLNELIEDESTDRLRPGVSNDSFDDHEALNGFQGRLLYTLYIEHLYSGILKGLYDLAEFCDGKREHFPYALHLPTGHKFKKVFYEGNNSILPQEEYGEISSAMPPRGPRKVRASNTSIYDVSPRSQTHYTSRMFRKIHNGLTACGDWLCSPESLFGFRVACAVMSIAIIALLHPTQQFFFNQRGIWAIVFLPFAMAPSSGESKAMAIQRFCGSVFAIPISLVNWYIVDEHPAGIVVFYFILAFIIQYFNLRFVDFGQFWRPCLYTHAIIIGYSLQERYTHVPMVPATNYEQFPPYKIGPYRCVCVLIGVTMGYIWSTFPKAITVDFIIRQRLGQALFTLEEYHSCMHLAVGAWASGRQGSVEDKYSVAGRLMKARQKLFIKETEILGIIREHHVYARYDSPFSGRYPGHAYMTITDEVDNIMSYFNNVIFVALSFQFYGSDKSKLIGPEKSPWVEGVSDLLQAFQSTSQHLAALIHVLASSLSNDQPLPPFLKVPEPFQITRRMKKLRPDLMEIQHIHEEGYKSIAIIEVSVALATRSLGRILHIVRGLNGEHGVMVEGIEEKIGKYE